MRKRMDEEAKDQREQVYRGPETRVHFFSPHCRSRALRKAFREYPEVVLPVRVAK